MNNLTTINYKGIMVIESTEVSEMTGKKHDNLLRDIRGYLKVIKDSSKLRSQDFFIESTYKNSQNKTQPCYLLTKQGCEMVANKMTGEKGVLFTAEYVTAFNKMEQHIKNEVQKPKQLSAMEQLKLQYQVLDEHEQKLDTLTEDVDSLTEDVKDIKNRMTIETGAQKTLCDLVSKKVTAILGGKGTPAYNELSKKAFRQCWKDYKDKLNVASYKDTPIKDFELGKKVIINWKPSRELELMILGCNAQIRM